MVDRLVFIVSSVAFSLSNFIILGSDIGSEMINFTEMICFSATVQTTHMFAIIPIIIAATEEIENKHRLHISIEKKNENICATTNEWVVWSASVSTTTNQRILFRFECTRTINDANLIGDYE